MEPNRNDFLKLMAAVAASAASSPAALAAPQQGAKAAASSEEQFIERIIEDTGAACRGALCYIGDRLGIFKAMAGAGPLTSAALARKTKLNERLLREWLNAMATAHYVSYRSSDKTYELPKTHAAILADEEKSALFLGGLFQLIVPMVSVAPKVAQSFRTSRPITMNDFPAEIVTGMERLSAPGFKHSFVQKWIPAMPGLQDRLRSGAAAVDVGCGAGIASITLAKAFPKARCFGYDPHGPSIERARENAAKAGVAGRVEFVAADSSSLPAGKFDFLTIFNSVHHFSDPVGLLTHCRKALAPGGICFILDHDLSANVEENMHAAGRLSYAATTLWCLHDSMANHGAGLGSEFGESILRGIAGKSGFSRLRKLPESTPFEAYYELRV